MGVSVAITQNLQGLGPYRIESLLGFNGMFASFKGTDPKTQKSALIVAVHQSWISDPSRWEAHKKAFEILQTSDPGPQICAPLKDGQDAAHYWCSYQWLDGGHLGARIRDNGLPTSAEAFRWISEAARGLSVLHRRDLRHQIINPASIFLKTDGQISLLHTGWGALIRGGPDGLLNPSFACILPFSAPEVATGGEGDESSDVYALGANLYYLLTGAPPFWNDDPSILAKMIEDEPISLDALRASLPRPAVDLLDEMLHKSGEDRPVNIPALVDRLALAAKAIETKEAMQNEVLSRTGSPQSSSAVKIPQSGADRLPSVHVGAATPGSYTSLDAPEPEPAAPTAPVAAPITRARPTAARAKNKAMTMLITGGVALLLAILLLAGIPLYISSKSKAAKLEMETNAPDRKKGDVSYEKYSAAAARLRVLGQLSMGYFKQNGNWPSDIKGLEAMGAKTEELSDAWGRTMDARPGGFIVSAGANGKWDDDDDIWWDSVAGKQDGFMPAKPAPNTATP